MYIYNLSLHTEKYITITSSKYFKSSHIRKSIINSSQASNLFKIYIEFWKKCNTSIKNIKLNKKFDLLQYLGSMKKNYMF